MVHVDRRHLKNRQAVEVEIPATDLWQYYHEMVQGTTALALPGPRSGEQVCGVDYTRIGTVVARTACTAWALIL